MVVASCSLPLPPAPPYTPSPRPPPPRPAPAASYTASFKFDPARTPCDAPLTATSTQRLVVDSPGNTPAPPPVTTKVTVTFQNCPGGAPAAASSPMPAPAPTPAPAPAPVDASGGAAARFSEVWPVAGYEFPWALEKVANATSVTLARGGAAAVQYRVTATRLPPRPAFHVSGSLIVTVPPPPAPAPPPSPPPGGGAAAGAKLLPLLPAAPAGVPQVSLKLSSGDAAGGNCSAGVRDPLDGRVTTTCRFRRLPFTVPPGGNLTALLAAPAAVSAEVLLSDGRRLAVPPTPFALPALPPPPAPSAGGDAELTDSFDEEQLEAMEAAGLKWSVDKAAKPPPADESTPPAQLNDTRSFSYAAQLSGVKRCGAWTLPSVAVLTPRGPGRGGPGVPVVAESGLAVIVQGCPLPLEAAMGLFTTYEVRPAAGRSALPLSNAGLRHSPRCSSPR
jgi:hypothetical protein